MRETDRHSFDAVTQAMTKYALRAYEGVVALIIDDYKNHRCTFPATIMSQQQQEAILAQPGNRAVAWIEILSNMMLAMDTEDVFSPDVLNGFVQCLITEIEAHRNPFSDKLAACVNDEKDEDDTGDLDVTMDDVHVNEAVRSLVRAYYTDTSVLTDETYTDPHPAMEKFLGTVRFMPETFDLLLQVCDLFEHQLVLHRKSRTNIRKPKKLEKIDAAMTQTYMELVMTMAHNIYTFGTTPKAAPLTPTAAVKYAVAVFGTIGKFDARHVAGRLRSCLMPN